MLPLIAQREARAAAVRQAQYNLNRCRVVSPFDARVTQLTISEGAYAHIGQRVFTLIDVRSWWVIGNFRESQLKYIRPGDTADLYVMSKPNQRFAGTRRELGFWGQPARNGSWRKSSPSTAQFSLGPSCDEIPCSSSGK